MKFIMNYRKLNNIFFKNPYTLPIIGKIIQQLEGLKYATAFDLNMEYYNIDIYPKSRDLATIVTEFGKFRYNILPMGLCA